MAASFSAIEGTAQAAAPRERLKNQIAPAKPKTACATLRAIQKPATNALCPEANHQTA